jgi:hypothetical protein
MATRVILILLFLCAPAYAEGPLYRHKDGRVNQEFENAYQDIRSKKMAGGTYTPTLTNIANLDSVTGYEAQYMRVGNTVTVSGEIDVDPTLAATATRIGISLPISSNFSNTQNCGGVAFAPGIAGQGAGIFADNTNDRAEMRWVSDDVSSQAMYFTFTYKIN